jgi:hypothetical protein
MLPSLFASGRSAQAWSLTRAATYGAGAGALAALFKTMRPGHGAGLSTSLPEIAAAALGFALLCAAAAGLRNFIAQRLD